MKAVLAMLGIATVTTLGPAPAHAAFDDRKFLRFNMGEAGCVDPGANWFDSPVDERTCVFTSEKHRWGFVPDGSGVGYRVRSTANTSFCLATKTGSTRVTMQSCSSAESNVVWLKKQIGTSTTFKLQKKFAGGGCITTLRQGGTNPIGRLYVNACSTTTAGMNSQAMFHEEVNLG